MGYTDVQDHNVTWNPTFVSKGLDKGMNVLQGDGMLILGPFTSISS